jgi:hypothetical protein
MSTGYQSAAKADFASGQKNGISKARQPPT